MKIQLVRISNAERREGEYKGLATSGGAQILVKMGPMLTYYKFHTKTGMGIGGAKGWAITMQDLQKVKDKVKEELRKRYVAEELRKPL
jgi:hypothetical protein